MNPAVLLVEDDPDDEALTLLALRRCRPDLRVTTVHDGREALDVLLGPAGAPAAKFRLVLLDLKMPRISGLEVLAALAQAGLPDPPAVLVFSSSTEPRDAAEAKRLGGAGYFQKLTDFDAFVASMGQALVRWLPPEPGPGHAGATTDPSGEVQP